MPTNSSLKRAARAALDIGSAGLMKNAIEGTPGYYRKSIELIFRMRNIASETGECFSG